MLLHGSVVEEERGKRPMACSKRTLIPILVSSQTIGGSDEGYRVTGFCDEILVTRVFVLDSLLSMTHRQN